MAGIPRSLRQIGASDQPRPIDPTRARRAGQQDAYEFGDGLEPRGRQITVKLQRDGGLAFATDGSIYARIDGTILTVERGKLALDLGALVAALPITTPGLSVSSQTGRLGPTLATNPGDAPTASVAVLATHVDDLRNALQAAGQMEN